MCGTHPLKIIEGGTSQGTKESRGKGHTHSKNTEEAQFRVLKESKQEMGTYLLESREGGTCWDSTGEQVSEQHSHPRKCEGRGRSGTVK